MYTELEPKAKLSDLLNEVKILTNNKTAVSGGKLKNDFGNIIYLTNNRIRANRLNDMLAEELASNINLNTIIPPQIAAYPTGFLLMAAYAKFGYADSLNICKYSDEWLNLFLYGLSKKTIEESFFADIYGETENKRANLTRDFRAFIKDVILNLKENNINALLQDTEITDTAKYFLETYKEYKKEEENFKEAENQFLHPLSAYQYLYKNVKSVNLSKVIIAENFDMLEPLFQEVLKNLSCPVYIIKDEVKDKTHYRDNTSVYNFMTPLDEAEFIGWKVKDLMLKGASGNDIGIACANGQSREILESVLRRMEINGDKQITFIENPYYRLVKTMFMLIHGQENFTLNLKSIFYDTKSKFFMEKGFYKLQQLFSEKGLKAKTNMIESLKNAIEQFTGEYKDNSEYSKSIKVLENFKAVLTDKTLKITEIANKTINDKTNKTVINDIMLALYELDTNLPDNSAEDYVKTALALFAVTDKRELNAPRQELFIDKKEEDNTYQQKEYSYGIEISKLDAARTLKAKYLFICGLNASSDKDTLLNYPDILAKKLNLPDLQEKKRQTAQSIADAVNTSKENHISYAYLNINCKADGQSSVIKTLLRDDKVKNIIGEGGKLLKSYDLIKLDNNLIPDNSWLSVKNEDKDLTEEQLNDFTKELFNGISLEQFLQTVLGKKEDNKYHIAVKDFADFLICPRQFIFNLLARYANIETHDEESVQRMTKGSFWHKVFETAAKKEDFKSKDINKVESALQNALEQTVNETDISAFSTASKDTFLDEENKTTVTIFSKNEIERQIKNSCKPLSTEEKLQLEITGTPFLLSGKTDRIDETQDGGYIFFDYKTGTPKPDKITIVMSNKKILHPNQNSLQLALYMYIYAQNNNIDITKLKAANIYINGCDNMNDKIYTPEQMNLLKSLLDKSIEHFKNNLKADIQTINRQANAQICNENGKKCTYCSFKYACGIID